MKKTVILLLTAAMLLSLWACTRDGGPVTPHIMYEGKLYEIPEMTTGIAFDEDTRFGEVTILDADTLPTADGECNIHAQSVQTYDTGNCLVIIVDGTQYILEK